MENGSIENKNTATENVKIVKTDEGAKDGQQKCPKCGATDISLNVKTGKLRCNYCRYEFEQEKIETLETNIEHLEGQVLASGTSNIVENASNIITLKCESCGAEVVIDTNEAPQARCHWCRNHLSINTQVPNGTIPDAVLPFAVSKEDAKKEIETFVGKRKFFAHPVFQKEFTTENIMGVYFPYMLVDLNTHAHFIGKAEHMTRQYVVTNDGMSETLYDADLYDIEREFDLTIEGLTVESNIDRLNSKSGQKANNIIHSIMPFDVINCVKWNANYLKGYTSEKRDTNVSELEPLVKVEARDIARYSANDTMKQYDRGAAWDTQDITVKGEQWRSAYLPVWLYSYLEIKGEKKFLHYVAVNARTKETMGSVPIHMPKLILVSCLVELFGFLAMMLIDFDYNFLFLLSGVVYFFVNYSRYRNHNARHSHETETKRTMSNLKQKDTYIRRKTGLSNRIMMGANNTEIETEKFQRELVKTLEQKKENNGGNEK